MNRFGEGFHISDEDRQKAIEKITFRSRILVSTKMKASLEKARSKLLYKKSQINESSSNLN